MRNTHSMLTLVIILLQINLVVAEESYSNPFNPTADTLNSTYSKQQPQKKETIEPFNLALFKLPYIKYQQLTLKLGADQEARNEKWLQDVNLSSQDLNYKLNTSLYVNYNLSLNAERQQMDLNISSSSFVPFIKSIQESESVVFKSESQHIQSSFSLSGSMSKRRYLKNLFFVEINPSAWLSQIFMHKEVLNDYYYMETPYESSIIQNNFGINANLKTGLGYGRIEIVTDAQMALFILNDLKKENRIEKEPSHSEIYELAELISTIRTKRFFDTRHKLIAEVKAIDSLLSSQGIINQQDATYFTTIYDNWRYAHNPSRLAGFRYAAGPLFSYYMLESKSERIEILSDTNQETTSENKSISNQLGYGLYINGSIEKPLNNKWQQSTQIKIEHLIQTNSLENNTNPESIMLRNSTFAQLQSGWGHYPNTRTYLNMGGAASWYNHRVTQNNSGFSIDDNLYFINYFSVSVNLNGYYYFSPQFSIRLSSSFGYNHNNSDNRYNLPSPPLGWPADNSTSSRFYYNDFFFDFSLSFLYGIL